MKIEIVFDQLWDWLLTTLCFRILFPFPFLSRKIFFRFTALTSFLKMGLHSAYNMKGFVCLYSFDLYKSWQKNRHHCIYFTNKNIQTKFRIFHDMCWYETQQFWITFHLLQFNNINAFKSPFHVFHSFQYRDFQRWIVIDENINISQTIGFCIIAALR